MFFFFSLYIEIKTFLKKKSVASVSPLPTSFSFSSALRRLDYAILETQHCAKYDVSKRKWPTAVSVIEKSHRGFRVDGGGMLPNTFTQYCT